MALPKDSHDINIFSTDGFKLRQRALHVFSEALRVPEFQKACNEGGDESEKLNTLGRLMDESQASCR